MTQHEALHSTIVEKLKFTPGLDASNIAISVNENGVIVIAGKVKSYSEKFIAENAVKNVRGVRAIANELSVDLASGYKRSDADIARKSVDALLWDVFIPDDRIKITVDNGHINLSGEVEGYFQKRHAENAIRNIVGVRDITNLITIKSSVRPADVKEKIIQEFERNARIDAKNIDVTVDGSEVILKGKVRNFDEKDEAITAAWSVPGITKVKEELTLKL